MSQAAEFWIKAVERYGCTRCQTHHYSDTDLKVFIEHKHWQSKHGVEYMVETIHERGRRYGLPQYSHHSVRE